MMLLVEMIMMSQPLLEEMGLAFRVKEEEGSDRYIEEISLVQK
jgi:hypothetical protein